ncbi:MAG: hypothetical protein ACRD3N_19735 [Terracidiphilus sp.]
MAARHSFAFFGIGFNFLWKRAHQVSIAKLRPKTMWNGLVKTKDPFHVSGARKRARVSLGIGELMEASRWPGISGSCHGSGAILLI